MRLKSLAVVLTAVVLLGGVGSAASAKPFNGGVGGPVNCVASDLTTVLGTFSWSPAALWPPNHKMKTITIGYTDTSNDAPDTIGIAVAGMDSSQGTNSHEPDVAFSSAPVTGADGTSTPDLTTTVQVRAERDGHGDPTHAGRTYTIHMTCSDADTVPEVFSTGTADLTVTVPHDRHSG